jgi:hypothetical protein
MMPPTKTTWTLHPGQRLRIPPRTLPTELAIVVAADGHVEISAVDGVFRRHKTSGTVELSFPRDMFHVNQAGRSRAGAKGEETAASGPLSV